jgi:hypothetical protein
VRTSSKAFMMDIVTTLACVVNRSNEEAVAYGAERRR